VTHWRHPGGRDVPPAASGSPSAGPGSDIAHRAVGSAPIGTGVGPNKTRTIFRGGPVGETVALPPVEVVDGLAVEALPVALAHLLALQARVVARLTAGTGVQAVVERDTDLLEAKEAAKLLKMSEDWLYKNAKRLPFTRRVGLRSLRFSAEGIRRYLASRRP
jgi:predicted DNA-binding transcriptional regulator AlpA